MCAICFCDVPQAEATAMDCSHTFCNDCWHQHCRVQIEEGQSRRLKCMASGCGAHCDEDKARILISYSGNSVLQLDFWAQGTGE